MGVSRKYLILLFACSLFMVGCKSEIEEKMEKSAGVLDFCLVDHSTFRSNPEKWLGETMQAFKRTRDLAAQQNNKKVNDLLKEAEEVFYKNFKIVALDYILYPDRHFRRTDTVEMTFIEAVEYAKTVKDRNDAVINDFLTNALAEIERNKAAKAELDRLNGTSPDGKGRGYTANKLQEFWRTMGLKSFTSFVSGPEGRTLNIYFSPEDMSSSQAVDLVRRNGKEWRSEGFTSVRVVDQTKPKGQSVLNQAL